MQLHDVMMLDGIVIWTRQRVTAPELASQPANFWVIVGPQVAAKQMVGVYLSVWVRRPLLQHLRGVQVTSIGTGVLGLLGNKGGILPVLAGIETQSKTYFFMPLATCDMYSLLHGKRPHNHGLDIPQDTEQATTRQPGNDTDHYLASLVPQNYRQRLHMLEWMADLAKPLRYLHHEFGPGSVEQGRDIVYHGDVKTKNRR